MVCQVSIQIIVASIKQRSSVLKGFHVIDLVGTYLRSNKSKAMETVFLMYICMYFLAKIEIFLTFNVYLKK